MNQKIADQFKRQFEIMLRDTIKPEIEIAKNSLIGSITEPLSTNAPELMEELGDWAASLLKDAMNSAQSEIYEVIGDKNKKNLWGDEE